MQYAFVSGNFSTPYGVQKVLHISGCTPYSVLRNGKGAPYGDGWIDDMRGSHDPPLILANQIVHKSHTSQHTYAGHAGSSV